MNTKITNYDGSVVTVPQKLVRPESVEIAFSSSEGILEKQPG